MIKILLDMDPGIDDLLNLIWISKYVKQKQITISAISIVSGNTNVFNAYRNCYCMLKILELDDIVIAKPIENTNDLNKNGDVIDFHGDDGAGGFSKLPYFSSSEFQKEIIDNFNNAPYVTDLFSKLINDNLYDLTLISTGPLTNVADLLKNDVHIGNKLKQFIMMGGAFNVPGNMSPYAEFNIWFDPESANYVLQNMNNIIIIPLDTTNNLQISFDDINKICNQSNVKNIKLADCMKNIFKVLTDNSISYRDADLIGFKIHDAGTFMYLLHPELFKLCSAFVTVEISKGTIAYGKTCIDYRNKKDHINIPTSKFAFDVDSKRGIFLLLCDLNDILCC